eukprot:COSAG06_NODE_2459_length_6837_cov_11.462897_9_plen_60_part_00
MRFSAGMPRVLVVIGSWISQVVSVDLQFGNPECGERKRSFKAMVLYIKRSFYKTGSGQT